MIPGMLPSGDRAGRQPNGDVHVRVGLPLPLGVSATLIQLVGHAWPDAKLLGDDRDMVLVLPAATADRARRAKPKHVRAADPGEDVADVVSFQDGTLTAAPRDDVAEFLGHLVYQVLDGNDGEEPAANYLAWTMHSRDGRPGVFLAASRSEGQTPDALHRLERDRVQRVRDLHTRLDRPAVEDLLEPSGEVIAEGRNADVICAHDKLPWPCATVKALQP